MYTQCYVHTDCQEVWVTRAALILEGKIPHLDTTFFFVDLAVCALSVPATHYSPLIYACENVQHMYPCQLLGYLRTFDMVPKSATKQTSCGGIHGKTKAPGLWCACIGVHLWEQGTGLTAHDNKVGEALNTGDLKADT